MPTQIFSICQTQLWQFITVTIWIKGHKPHVHLAAVCSIRQSYLTLYPSVPKRGGKKLFINPILVTWFRAAYLWVNTIPFIEMLSCRKPRWLCQTSTWQINPIIQRSLFMLWWISVLGATCKTGFKMFISPLKHLMIVFNGKTLFLNVVNLT